MNIKKNFLLVSILLGAMNASISYAATYRCGDAGPVTELSAGVMGQDNMIKARINGTDYEVHPDSRLNHSAGNALLTLLLYSKSTGTAVQLFTHSSGDNKDCKKKQFDEVYITNS